MTYPITNATVAPTNLMYTFPEATQNSTNVTSNEALTNLSITFPYDGETSTHKTPSPDEGQNSTFVTGGEGLTKLFLTTEHETTEYHSTSKFSGRTRPPSDQNSTLVTDSEGLTPLVTNGQSTNSSYETPRYNTTSDTLGWTRFSSGQTHTYEPTDGGLKNLGTTDQDTTGSVGTTDQYTTDRDALTETSITIDQGTMRYNSTLTSVSTGMVPGHTSTYGTTSEGLRNLGPTDHPTSVENGSSATVAPITESSTTMTITALGGSSDGPLAESEALTRAVLILIEEVPKDILARISPAGQPLDSGRGIWLRALDVILDAKTNKMALGLGVILFLIIIIGLQLLTWARNSTHKWAMIEY